MRRSRSALLMVLLALVACTGAEKSKPIAATDAIQFGPQDWPWWRGPERNGIADSQQSPPQKWSETEGVLWKVPVTGHGHSSPTVVGDQIFLATADLEKQQQSVLCFDRQTGKQLWQTIVHQGGLDPKGNGKSTLASSTVACDGEKLYINFFNSGAIFTTALNRAGEQQWQTRLGDYAVHQGFGSSPALYQSLVLVSADSKAEGMIAGLSRADGKIVWQHDRPKMPNYTSPIILKVAGREQALFTGCELVAGYDPLSGEQLWKTEGATTECVTSTVTDGNIIITSGGYPKNHVSAVLADGTGKLVWENPARVYVPSMLIQDGYLYAILDAGVAMCWKASDGEEVWKGRIGGTFSASPVIVGKHLFATDESGRTCVMAATPDGFDLQGENQLGDEVFATPTFCGNRIYYRAATQVDGKRQEWLYCLGAK